MIWIKSLLEKADYQRDLQNSEFCKSSNHSHKKSACKCKEIQEPHFPQHRVSPRSGEFCKSLYQSAAGY